jgi:hypothetical protein
MIAGRRIVSRTAYCTLDCIMQQAVSSKVPSVFVASQATFMTHRSRILLLASLVLTLTVGCGGSPNGNATPLPDPSAARQAMNAALESWKVGRPTGHVEPGSPRIQLNDSFRKPGQILDRYEILGQIAGERAISFVVKATLSNPSEVETIRFLLLGTDPVIVFRQEDYELLSHFEHKMDPPPNEPAT